MNKEVKAEWIRVLRSGKFKQARGTLCRDKRTLCCLGVGAVVADKSFKPVPGMGTIEAVTVLGISESLKDRLVDLNDYREWSFKQIAKYIEANL